MRLVQLAKPMTRRLGRLLRLTFVIGVIPLLVTSCYRGTVANDHLIIQSGSPMFPSLSFVSGGGLSCSVSPPPKNGTWSVTTWHDYYLDCHNVVLFLDVDTRGPGFEVTVGYEGLILLTAAALTWSWRRERRLRASAAGGFEIQPVNRTHSQVSRSTAPVAERRPAMTPPR